MIKEELHNYVFIIDSGIYIVIEKVVLKMAK